MTIRSSNEQHDEWLHLQIPVAALLLRSVTTFPCRVVVLLALVLAAVAGAEPGTPAPGRLMAVSIDDLPAAPPTMHTTSEQASITEDLLAALKRHRLPAIGFVNENKLEVAGEVEPGSGANRMTAWHVVRGVTEIDGVVVTEVDGGRRQVRRGRRRVGPRCGVGSRDRWVGVGFRR